MHPQMPRFQGYFNSMSGNKHPFESIGREEVDLEQDHAEQVEFEKYLHRRELMGRLMAERLTPRQFELLSGIHNMNGGENLECIRGADN